MKDYSKYNRLENLLVVDIETIPDTDVAYNLLHLDNNKNYTVPELRDLIKEYHLKATDGRNDFTRQLFHRVVCISYLEASIETIDDTVFYRFKKLDSYSSFKSSEEELLRKFWQYVAQVRPKIVSFNGKTFDLPVLKYRALKYNIPCQWFFNFGDKWTNYNTRYSEAHTDMLDLLSDYGASARIKMLEVCALLNIPCKVDNVDGGSVTAMFDNQQYKEIRQYCENDVLATYLIYLRFAILTGHITLNNYNIMFDDILQYLKEHNIDMYHTWSKAQNSSI